MADLDRVELGLLKSINVKVKSMGNGITTFHWVNGKIVSYEVSSSNTAENIYQEPTLGNPIPNKDLLD